MLRGILTKSGQKVLSSLSTFSLHSSLSARKENQQCSVKSPLLINEYFLNREGKEGLREKRGKSAPMGQSCMHGRVAVPCQPKEIHQRERPREMEQEEKREAEGGSQAGD